MLVMFGKLSAVTDGRWPLLRPKRRQPPPRSTAAHDQQRQLLAAGISRSADSAAVRVGVAAAGDHPMANGPRRSRRTMFSFVERIVNGKFSSARTAAKD